MGRFGVVSSSTRHFSLREEHQALHLWGSLISWVILDGFPTSLSTDDSFYDHPMLLGKFSLSHQRCLTFPCDVALLLCLAMQRHPHKPALWANNQFLGCMILQHQFLVNQAPTATLTFAINLDFFQILFSLWFSLPVTSVFPVPSHLFISPTPQFGPKSAVRLNIGSWAGGSYLGLFSIEYLWKGFVK